ncbi:MAG: hypothetical protein NT170_01810 [Candidatus Moranbacteria bacterium]|nr:hypothetical protein [Candidatus Moranbacteria bacterium]
MREDIRENFVLLSKIAKEKKYAQEYLGLLARRGDIGSIRIGKRWYTTWAWFEEFLENSQKKKIEGACEIKIAQPAMVEPEKIAVAVNPNRDQITIRKNIAVEKINISMPVLSSCPFPFKVQTGEIRMRRTVAEPIRKAPIRNFAPVKKMQPILQDEPKLTNPSVEEKNRYAVPYQEIRFKKKKDIFSPDFAGEEKMVEMMFSRFAFAMSFAVVLLLVAASGYFVWSGGLLTRGQVAGASDERNVGFSGITSGGEYVLVSAGNKMKESLSVSRVMVEAAKERVNQSNLVN